MCHCKTCIKYDLECQCFKVCDEKDCKERELSLCSKTYENLKGELEFNKFIEKLTGGDYRLPEK